MRSFPPPTANSLPYWTSSQTSLMPKDANAILNDTRCPSRSVSASTPSQSNSIASSCGDEDDAEDGEDAACRGAEERRRGKAAMMCDGLMLLNAITTPFSQVGVATMTMLAAMMNRIMLWRGWDLLSASIIWNASLLLMIWYYQHYNSFPLFLSLLSYLDPLSFYMDQ